MSEADPPHVPVGAEPAAGSGAGSDAGAAAGPADGDAGGDEGGPHIAAARLVAWAREAGFDAAGVATLEPLERGGAFLRWLERGDQADMGYLENRIEARLEPERILEGARSALCVALRYAPLATRQEEDGEGSGQDFGEDAGRGDAGAGAGPGRPRIEPPPEGELWPRVARYARGRDYHHLMGKRLKKLARRIRDEVPGADTRVYVDTGPVLERELAARAGIGVPGKNTNLLSREMGSWFLLGEVFTNLEPVWGAADPGPPEPLADLCSRCTLCLEACPTGALPEPYRLDANRCISYWTIEHRGTLPKAMREAVGDWVFGCDVCQEVCPWNRRYEGRSDRGGREPADHPDLLLPPHRRELDLRALLALRRGEYEKRFRGSAMKRARLEGLKRNAAVAMGNRRDPAYVAALARALEEEDDPVVRTHAAWALGHIGGEAAAEALRAALARMEGDAGRRGAAESPAAKGQAGDAQAEEGPEEPQDDDPGRLRGELAAALQRAEAATG